MLFTTRDATIADPIGALPHWVEMLSQKQSREMFACWAGVDLRKLLAQGEEIIAQCCQLPLALAMEGAMVREKPAQVWQHTLELLENADLARINAQFPNYKHPSLFVAIQASVDAMEPDPA